MQISENIFLDIEIPELGKSKFLGATDVFNFKLKETAGSSLPWILMVFRTNSADIKNSFKQNNKINVTFGATIKDADTFPVVIETSKVGEDPSGTGWIVEFAGFLYNKSYMVNQESRAYTGTSVDVVRKVYYQEMNKPVDLNFPEAFENEVTWRKINQSACSFLANVILHMRLYPSFPLFGINKYGTLILRDFKALCAEGPKYTFSTNKESLYVIWNNFNVKNDRDLYNMYSGYNKRIEITDSVTGKKYFQITDNSPILASTQVSESLGVGSTVASNEIQSSNVHEWYNETYIYNTNNQVALSSINGEAVLLGRYYKELNPLDLIKLETGSSSKNSLDGLYLIESIETRADITTGTIVTTVTLTRDNVNYIENYVRRAKGLKIRSQFMQKLCAAIYDLRRAYAVSRQFVDGTFMGRLLGFALDTKRNLLRMFSIAGVSIDFNSNADLLKSFILLGNSLMNSLISMLFPLEIAYTFRDYLLWKPSLRTLLSRYINEFVPLELQDIINSIVESLDTTTSTLNSIAKDNGITITKEDVKQLDESGILPLPTIPSEEEPPVVTPVDSVSEITEEDEMNPDIEDITDDSQQRVIEIIEDFTERTEGIDLPFPIITLDESQVLLSDVALKEYVANQTIANLTNLGYLKNMSKEEVEKFKDTLVSEEETTLPFTIINKIKSNVGLAYNYKYWGTYDDLINLTSFNIRNSYKDKYRTIPCTKLINASKDAKIFFACPRAENDLRFYINSKRVEVGDQDSALMGTFEIDLGHIDSSGNRIPYSVYYTKIGYNSNSILFEVKQGGII